jgi:uncharacterized membrane protein
MLIGYPVAFYTGTLAGYAVWAATKDVFWLKLAIALNIAGVGMALVAAMPGFIDWLFAIPRKTAPKRTGMIHALLNVAALGLFGATLGVYVRFWNTPATMTATLAIVLCAVGIGLTILAGFQGWILVQDHHMGVKLTPEQKRLDGIEHGQIRRAS